MLITWEYFAMQFNFAFKDGTTVVSTQLPDACEPRGPAGITASHPGCQESGTCDTPELQDLSRWLTLTGLCIKARRASLYWYEVHWCYPQPRNRSRGKVEVQFGWLLDCSGVTQGTLYYLILPEHRR
eukprot:1949831-Pyramimonas_sp.AAC.1